MSEAENEVGQAGEPVSEQLRSAAEILANMLNEHGGCVSSKALRKQLEIKGFSDAGDLVRRLKFGDAASGDTILPGFKYYYHGRSFYSEAGHRAVEERFEAAAEEAGAAEERRPAEELIEEEEPVPRCAEYRQEEARLVTYVKRSGGNI